MEKTRQALPSGSFPLTLGRTFGNNHSPYHTVRYDFRPASVEGSEKQYLQIGQNNEVKITIPKLNADGDVVNAVVFRGSKKPYAKECLLIIDHDTNEIVIERLTSTMQVKKTRGDVNVKLLGQFLQRDDSKAGAEVQHSDVTAHRKRPHDTVNEAADAGSVSAGCKDSSNDSCRLVCSPKRAYAGNEAAPSLSSDDDVPAKAKMAKQSPCCRQEPDLCGKVNGNSISVTNKTINNSHAELSGRALAPAKPFGKSVLHTDLQLSDSDDD